MHAYVIARAVVTLDVPVIAYDWVKALFPEAPHTLVRAPPAMPHPTHDLMLQHAPVMLAQSLLTAHEGDAMEAL